MNYCVPIEEDFGWQSRVYGHFGSAPCFALLDPAQPGEPRLVANPNCGHAHGHCNPVGAIASLAVGAVIVNGIGLRALQRLEAAGIAVYATGAETLDDIRHAIANGALVRMDPESACAGHGDGHDHHHE